MYPWFVLIGLAMLTSTATQAQTTVRYCDGKLLAHSFYSTVQTNGISSVVSYHMQLQNTSGQPIRYTVRFSAPGSLGAQNEPTGASLAPYQLASTTLGTQSLNNPTGNGRLRTPDVIQFTQVTCRM